MKENAYLEAGHRAPILEGFYAMGGGSTDRKTERKQGKIPNDDLAKVENNVKGIMNNHLLRDFNEHSRKKTQIMFREVIRDIGKQVADEVILFGNAHKFADGAYKKLLREGYLDQDYLDGYVKRAPCPFAGKGSRYDFYQCFE